MPEVRNPPAQLAGSGLAARADALADALFETMAGPGCAVLSPLSLLEALAPLMAAARGDTAARLRVGLFGGEAAEPLREFAALAGVLRGPLCGCAALWASPAEALLPGYAATLEAIGTEMRELDLSSTDAATIMNAWVSERTRNLVPAIVTVLPSSAVAVVTAALHFAAHWAQGFDPAETRPGAFARPDAPPVDVPFLRATLADAAYARDEALQAVRLGYAGGEFEFLALAPAPGEDPSAVLGLMRERRALSLLRHLQFVLGGGVRVELPRFAVASPALDLLPGLRRSPLAAALGADADYGGATGRPWSVSKLLHRAAIRIDESGTEAAAASAVILGRSLRSGPPLFRADSPFLAAVRHRETQAVIVAALVTDPSQMQA